MIAKTIRELTPKQSQEARRSLALSQNQVIAQTGIQAYKLKQFEKRFLQIEQSWHQKLREFYEAQGADWDQIDAQIEADELNELKLSRGSRAIKSGITPIARPGFLISDTVSQEQVDRALDRMEANDGRVAELIATAYSEGFMGGPSDEAQTAMRDLFGTLAESHLLFRFLQGKNVITKAVDGTPETLGDALSQWVKDSPVYEVFDLTDDTNGAKSKAKAKRDTLRLPKPTPDDEGEE